MNRRCFAPEIPLPGAEVELSEAETRHLTGVLRAREGEELGLLDGHGTHARVRLVQVPRKRGAARCRILERITHPEPPRHLWLYLAPPRAKLMDQVLRQATELGAWGVQPVLCARSVARPDPESLAAWEVQTREACKQSGNPWLPDLREPRSLPELLADSPAPGYFGSVPTAGDRRPAARPETGDVTLWIGPEGGFTPEEDLALREAGLQPLRLGPWTLRVETAAIAGLAWLQGGSGP